MVETITTIFAWMNERPNLAAWLQAVGAIVAIIVAFWVAGRQQRAADRSAWQQRELRAHALAFRACGIMTLINEEHRRVAMVYDRGGANPRGGTISSMTAPLRMVLPEAEILSVLENCHVFEDYEIGDISRPFEAVLIYNNWLDLASTAHTPHEWQKRIEMPRKIIHDLDKAIDDCLTKLKERMIRMGYAPPKVRQDR